jgi:type II secretory pathway component PulF
VATAFSYTAVDRTGRKLRGREAAATGLALTQQLETRGLLVLRLTPAEQATAAKTGFGPARRREVLEITRALAALLPAGLPLARALDASSNLAQGEVAGALESVQSNVERGQSLAASLAEHPRLFSPLYLGLVRAGERSGDLAGAFRRLAIQLEREEALRAKLLSASLYPLLLASAGGGAVLILLFFVLPRFVELLQGTGATLPATTAALLGLSSLFQRYWFVVAALPVMAALVLVWSRTTDEGRRALSALLLRLPVAGTLRRQALAARFARLVAVLLGGGAPLVSALDDSLECLDDPLARDEVARIRARVREGAALRSALGEGDLFPPVFTQLVAVGEESGRLQDFVLKAADILEERAERSVQRLVALAEPAMILIFGGIVGFVALSLLQAIYSVNAGSFR